MAYTPRPAGPWVDGVSDLLAADMNRLEANDEDASDRLDALEAGGGGGSATVVHNFQTGTAYTLALTDAGKLVEMSNAAANTLTVPPNSSVAFPVGSRVLVRQYGAGLTTVAGGAGVTVRSFGAALKMGGQYAEAELVKRATDEWVLSGQVTP